MSHLHNVSRALMTACLLSGSAVTASAQGAIWSSAQHMTSSSILAVAQDRNGYIWVGTEYGLNRFDGYRYTYYLSDEEDKNSINDNCVTELYTDKAGTLWVGTRQGLQYYNTETDQFSAVKFDITWQPRVKQLCSGPDSTLWCATSGFGVWHVVDGEAHQLYTASNVADNGYYQTIALDREGRLWTGDQRGRVARLQVGTDNHYTEDFNYDLQMGEVVKILPHRGDSIYIVYEYGLACYDGEELKPLADIHTANAFGSALLRADGQLLLGAGRGLWRYTGSIAQPFEPVPCNVAEIDVTAANFRVLFEDRSGNLWGGCYQRGMLLLPASEQPDRSWNLSEYQRPSSSELTAVVGYKDGLLATLRGKGLYYLVENHEPFGYPELTDASSICADRNHGYWVATTRGIFSFDPDTRHARLVLPMSEPNVRRMTIDKQGRLYISDYGKGLLVYDPTTNKSRQYKMDTILSNDPDDRLCNDWILDLMTDSRGNIWCATASGTCCFDPRSETFCPFGWSVLYTDHLCQCLAEDADGNILVGTNDGAYIYNQRTRHLGETPLPGLGLMSRSVSGIVALPDHSVWMSTSRGIWLYDPEVGELQPYSHMEGTSSHEYNQAVAEQMPHGHIIFGQYDGFVIFDPMYARTQQFTPAPPVLTAFVMDNKVMKPGELSGTRPIYTGNVTEAHEFTLSHDENSFVMEFSSLKFDLTYRPLLQYSIDGGRWQDAVDQANVIPFYHMPPGEYKIRVRALYQNAYSTESLYTVHIRQPWYATWWMRMLYAMLILGFTGLCFIVWLRHKHTQVEDDKMKLLIDATHDIRTPLTLILSPLHQLSERYQNDADTSRKLQTINHNARRILTLVNQILDVRRYDKQQMPYNPQPTDLVRLINDNLQGFYFEAQHRKIELTFHHDDLQQVSVQADRSQFEKVIVNLVGNALKYTPDGGKIDLRLTQEGQQAVMRVIDSGVGLPNGETERIFHRFYQVSGQAGGEGTGIGLNLCHKIVQQHGGTITAASRTDGQTGSIFTVTLPLSNVAEEVEVRPAPAPVRQPSRSQRILLVDDDEEITNYITNELSGRYHFQSCRNGIEALRLLLSDPTRFDVMVSDIMMPEMDGMTLLRSIKSNGQIAHIPVVLLTSKAEIAYRLEGLSAGADAYMAKPFVIDELRATIDGLIANTQRHRNKYSGNVEAAKAASEQAADIVKSQMGQDSDSKMLERIVSVVNEHLSQADFGVDELCVEVGVSRSQLHRKMKEMTGVGAGEFIRNIRLEQAARMLKETDMNVSQVAYAVGFSNLGHFSKIFRTHFGVYPSDYSHE